MKKSSTFVKICLFIICLLLIVACVNKQQAKIIDEEHKTFYINGVSALDGYEAVSNSLKNIGFIIDKDGVQKYDLSFIGEDCFYSVWYRTEKLTDEQFSKLTYGLLENLPSGSTLNKNKDEDPSCGVLLYWYESGEIKECIIDFSSCLLSDEDEIEVNKRLSALFPHSKISNHRSGYKTYYDDNGVGVYFSGRLEISKKYSK